MVTDTHDKELLHLKEAAAELRVHVSTVRRHVHDGTIEAVRLGPNGRYRISRQAIADFMRPAHHSERSDT